MSGRKEYATGAVAIALLEAVWLIASSFQLVQGWITSLQHRGGAAANLSAFVTNPVFHFLMVCAALYLAIRAWRAGEETPPTPSPTATASPVQTQANPQNQTVTIYTHPPAVEAEKPRSTARPQLVEPRPNLVLLGTKTTKIVCIEEQALGYFSARGPGEEMPAVLVGFRNETISGGVRVCSAERSKAHIIYYDGNKNELGSILGACWLEEPGDLVDFDPGKSLWLVVAIFVKKIAIIPYYKRRPSSDGFGGEGIALEDEEIDGTQIETIEVRIIGEFEHELFRIRLVCSMDADGKPTLTKIGV